MKDFLIIRDYIEFGNVCTILGVHCICAAKNLQCLFSGFKNSHGFDINQKFDELTRDGLIKNIKTYRPFGCDIVINNGKVTDIIPYEITENAAKDRNLAVGEYIKFKKNTRDKGVE